MQINHSNLFKVFIVLIRLLQVNKTCSVYGCDLHTVILVPLTWLNSFYFTAIIEYFEKTMNDDPSTSEAVAAIKTLIEFIQLNSCMSLSSSYSSLKFGT